MATAAPRGFSGLASLEWSGHSSWIRDVLLLFSEAQQMSINTDTALLENEAITGFELKNSAFFQAHIKFPIDYPYSPPTFRFLTKMWHPNIYENGDVCISILHPPVDDPQSGELPSERWNPTQNVRTILLSVISLLNEPNTFSPANVDASVMFRKWRDSKGKDKEYAEIIRKQVLATKAEAEKDGVKVPTTLAEYCIKTKVPSNDNSSDLLYDDLYDDDIDDEDEEEEDADCYDDDDSGNEES
uniref:UBC core domain-containing protein n=1 Tax=Zonotrichia albicollis TaxID=44394 RepID=A0A8D2MYH7_ZONAL